MGRAPELHATYFYGQNPTPGSFQTLGPGPIPVTLIAPNLLPPKTSVLRDLHIPKLTSKGRISDHRSIG